MVTAPPSVRESVRPDHHYMSPWRLYLRRPGAERLGVTRGDRKRQECCRPERSSTTRSTSRLAVRLSRGPLPCSRRTLWRCRSSRFLTRSARSLTESSRGRGFLGVADKQGHQPGPAAVAIHGGRRVNAGTVRSGRFRGSVGAGVGVVDSLARPADRPLWGLSGPCGGDSVLVELEQVVCHRC